MVIPVHELNCAHDLCSESDSGLTMAEDSETSVPARPAYGWYGAQAPLNVGTGPGGDWFEQAPTANNSAIVRLRPWRLVIVDAPLSHAMVVDATFVAEPNATGTPPAARWPGRPARAWRRGSPVRIGIRAGRAGP